MVEEVHVGALSRFVGAPTQNTKELDIALKVWALIAYAQLQNNLLC